MRKNEAEKTAVRIHPALLITISILVFLAAAVLVLYPVARDYYVAYRQNQQLEAEYTAVLDRNGKIQQQIDELKTPEGIQDRAREEYGWVLPGEEAVNVTGLENTDSSTGLPSAIAPGSVKTPNSWWTDALDGIFQVEDEEEANPYPDDAIPGL